MQDGPNAKQLIAEKIKQSANILVTVSANPSVDALTAALGLSLMLNKLDKHATAVFSGVVPPAISFLQPNKTFENNVDSLRDFIIALDKDKADRLRYKVENDVVRIFITPYRTKISQKDLQFSQGDFNVDLIVALGVEDQKDLDQAITAHGRILHDATVATINPSSQKSSLGSIDWQDGKASSLSEMVASIADSLKQGILDQQISTALLTGIVASTERFSNQLTTPHVMTVAAGLMAAGANQQLIATKLQSIPAPVSPRREKPKQSDKPAAPDDSAAAGADGEMHINHGEQEEAPAELPKQQPKPAPIPAPEVESEPEAEPAEPVSEPEPQEEPELPIAPPAAQNFDDLKQAIKEDTAKPEVHHEMVQEPPTPGNHNINAEEADEPKPKSDEESYLTTHPSWMGREIEPPTMGGTLSATAEQALEDKQREEAEEHRNHKILTHGNPGESEEQPTGQQQPKKSRRQKQKQQPQAAQKPAPVPAPAAEPAPAPAPEPAPAPAPMPEPTPEAPPAPAPEEPQQAVVAEEPSLPPPPAPAPAPMPEPIAAPEPAPAPAPSPEPEIPIAPPPLVVSEPLMPPAAPAPQVPAPNTGAMSLPPVPGAPMPPAPEAQSAGPAHGEPTLEELERQAAHHAAQAAEGAPQTLSELEAAARGHAATAPSPTPEQAPAPAPATSAVPPMPDFSTLPPLPGAGPMPAQPQTPQLPPLPPDTQPVPEPEKPQAPPDPAQFRIPTQQ